MNNPGKPRIFFDTEFTDLCKDAKLISIGLVSEDGSREFYAELRDTWCMADVGDFARESVLPLLEGGASLMTKAELRERLKAWLESFEWPVQLATDSLSWDWPWIQEIVIDYNVNYDSLEVHDMWPLNLDKRPLILTQDPVFNMAVEEAFANGLRRHHALDDAKANRLGWIAAGGDAEKRVRFSV
jgi:hypothetical protein